MTLMISLAARLPESIADWIVDIARVFVASPAKNNFLFTGSASFSAIAYEFTTGDA